MKKYSEKAGNHLLETFKYLSIISFFENNELKIEEYQKKSRKIVTTFDLWQEWHQFYPKQFKFSGQTAYQNYLETKNTKSPNICEIDLDPYYFDYYLYDEQIEILKKLDKTKINPEKIKDLDDEKNLRKIYMNKTKR